MVQPQDSDGSPTEQVPQVQPPAPQQQPSGDDANRGLLIAILSVLGVLLVGGIVAGAYLIGRSSSDDDPEPADVASEPSATASTATTTPEAPSSTAATAPPATAAAPSGVGDVLSQPAGLFCRDLRAAGYSYSAAVDYWRHHGQPDRMDADLDGVPCETVYPAENIDRYWGDYGIVPTYEYYPVFDLPGGLLCRDLADAGYDTYDALSYYLLWGLPQNMDADGNGVPCETVYGDAEYVWFNSAF